MYKVLQTETFRKWFKRLRDDIAKFAIGQRIERIKSGNFGDSKSLGDNIFEFRVNVSKGYRVYFKNKGESIVILLVGGDKSSQDSDIKTAKKMGKEL